MDRNNIFLQPNTNENTIVNKVTDLLFEVCKTRCKYYEEIEYGENDEKSIELIETKCRTCPLDQIM